MADVAGSRANEFSAKIQALSQRVGPLNFRRKFVAVRGMCNG